LFIVVLSLEARFSQTKKGSPLLIDQAGFCYSLNRKNSTRAYWRCRHARTHKCLATATSEGLHIVNSTEPGGQTHSPFPDSEMNICQQTMNEFTHRKEKEKEKGKIRMSRKLA
jgi:hypothetical protein